MAGYETTGDTQLDETQLAAETDSAIERRVSVERVIHDVLHVGDCFDLRATLTGFENEEYSLQWQYSDGGDWIAVSGANELTLHVVANQYDVNYSWRILVSPVATEVSVNTEASN